MNTAFKNIPSLLTVALMGFSALLMQSCLKDQDDIFDTPSSLRLAEHISQVDSTLTAPDYGWSMDYYPEEHQSYGGFTYTMQFDGANVTIAGEGGLGVEPTYTATSLYSVKAGSGAQLTFDSYNELFHFFSTPTSSLYQSYGGCFEFIVDSLTDDVIKLHTSKGSDLNSDGNTVHSVMYLRRLTMPSDEYLTAVNSMASAFILTYAAYGDVTAEFDLDDRQVTLTDGTDAQTVAYAYTDKGLRLYEPVTVGGKTVWNFSFDDEALTLTCLDEGSTDVVFQGVLLPSYILKALGAASGSLIFRDKASSQSWTMKYGSMFSYSTDADWLTVSQDGNSLSIAASENNTGSLRVADIIVTSEAGSGTLRIKQYDMSELLGYYYLYDGSTGKPQLDFDLVETDGSYALTCQNYGYDLSIPIEIDAETNELYIESGAYWGNYGSGTYYVYPYYAYGSSGNTGAKTGVPYYISIDYDDDGSLTGTFYGTYGGYNLNTLYFGACNSQSFSSSTLLGYLEKINYPVLVKQ